MDNMYSVAFSGPPASLKLFDIFFVAGIFGGIIIIGIKKAPAIGAFYPYLSSFSANSRAPRISSLPGLFLFMPPTSLKGPKLS